MRRAVLRILSYILLAALGCLVGACCQIGSPPVEQEDKALVASDVQFVHVNGDRPFFNSLSEWQLNAATGEWRVGQGNNYVLNGSFEADRRKIPCPAKPRQDYLRGWETEFIKGTKVTFDNPDSLTLNYLNSQDDRRHVVGEKSLNITDVVDFERKVSQTITTMPYVDLPDGTYTMRARVRYGGRFDRLVMYAESGGKRETCNLNRGKQDNWRGMYIKKVEVVGGHVEVGFYAEGRAGAYCRVDDVELVRVSEE